MVELVLKVGLRRIGSSFRNLRFSKGSIFGSILLIFDSYSISSKHKKISFSLFSTLSSIFVLGGRRDSDAEPRFGELSNYSCKIYIPRVLNKKSPNAICSYWNF
jgi:hypothetical protein